MSEINNAGQMYDNTQAQQMISNFQTAHPNVNNSGACYGINKIHDLINQGNVEGFNIYFGQDNGQDTIVIYGADSEGKNIAGTNAIILESGIKIPK